MADITQESNEALWNQLNSQWWNEGRPAYLTRGNVQYLVIRATDGLKFRQVDREDLMQHTSFGG